MSEVTTTADKTIIATHTGEPSEPTPPVVVAPVTVVAPGQNVLQPGVNFGQENSTRVGGDAIGRDSDVRFGNVGSAITFQSQDNAVLFNAIIRQNEKLNDVVIKLDDLPTRVARLEAVKIDVSVQPLPVPVVVPVIGQQMWLILALVVFILGVGGFLLGRSF